MKMKKVIMKMKMKKCLIGMTIAPAASTSFASGAVMIAVFAPSKFASLGTVSTPTDSTVRTPHTPQKLTAKENMEIREDNSHNTQYSNS